MEYSFAILPTSLKNTLISESKRLMNKVYGKKVKKIYYRVKTKDYLDNPRRLFFRGDGRVIEAEVDPHVSLIHGIEIKDVSDFVKKAQKICSSYNTFNLEFLKKGNYNMDFTFFVRFKNIPNLGKLRSELLDLSKSFMPKEKYQQHVDASYVPHATVLYDDIDPERVNRAYKLLDTKRFQKPIFVQELVLHKMTASGQEIVAKLNLN